MRKSLENMYADLVEHVNSNKDEDTTDETTPPYQEDIGSLSDEEVKKWCAHFSISTGKKKIDTLKGLLLPKLPKKETKD
jgi:hypothetical protein